MFLLLLGLITGSATAYFGYKEYQANKKRIKLYEYVNYLTKDMRTNESIRDAYLIGAGSTAISVFSIYAALNEHSEILDVMEYRYPNELLEMSPLDWLTKVEQLYLEGDQAVDGFINGYTGQAAENITVEQFEAMGATASLFESRTHANDDIAVTMNGETVHYSVKSYADSDSFAQAVQAHPESTHYVVNQELYTQLEQSGSLTDYEAQGLTIIEGNYSNIALREEASKAFLDIHQAADVADHIPFLSIPLYALRSGFNIKAYREGKQSTNELAVNLVSDAGKIGVASGLGFGGAKLGGVIGTAFLPGVGTVIGGGIGAVIGAFAGSKFMDSLKSYFKWGKIIEVQENVGKTFERIGANQYKDYYLEHVFNINELKGKLITANEHSFRFNNQVDIYNNTKLTLPGVLNAMHIEHMIHIKNGFENTANLLTQKIEQFAEQCAIKMKKPQAKHALLGELLLQSETQLWHPDDKAKLECDIKQYKRESEKNPNYPYQFQMKSEEIIEGITGDLLTEQLQPKQQYSFLMPHSLKYRKTIIFLSIVTITSLILFSFR